MGKRRYQNRTFQQMAFKVKVEASRHGWTQKMVFLLSVLFQHHINTDKNPRLEANMNVYIDIEGPQTNKDESFPSVIDLIWQVYMTGLTQDNCFGI